MKTFMRKLQQRRKFLLALPVLILPFITLLFWVLGGGQATAGKQSITTKGGLNIQLPTPKLQEGFDGKLSLYQQAQRDARRRTGKLPPDAYNREDGNTKTTEAAFPSDNIAGKGLDPVKTPPDKNATPDNAEERIRKQLTTIQKQIDKVKRQDSSIHVPETLPVPSNYFDQTNQQPVLTTQNDPELTRLDGMLKKILDIQHPGRVAQRLAEKSREQREIVYSVNTQPGIPKAQLLKPAGKKTMNRRINHTGNAFYDNTSSHSGIRAGSAVPAVVHEKQTLVSGATLKLRLTRDIFINGIRIPKGHFIYGLCSITGERLKVNIKSIRYNDHLLPVNLSVYDMDGIEGIRVPGAISRNTVKQGMSTGLQSFDVLNMSPSLGAQAASAGIRTAKTLFGKKARMVQVTVQAGYPVLLSDNNKDQ